jgi:hypothetical protein
MVKGNPESVSSICSRDLIEMSASMEEIMQKKLKNEVIDESIKKRKSISAHSMSQGPKVGTILAS